LLHWLSFLTGTAINFHFFKIDIPKTNYIEPFAESVSSIMIPIVLYVIVPFYAIMFFYNINPKKVDIAWWTFYRHKTKRSRLRMISVGLFLGAVFLINILYTYGAIIHFSLSNTFNRNNYIFFTLSFLFNCFSYSFFSFGLIFCISCLWRYIGKFEGNPTSYEIVNNTQKQ
jgi:hypothetical protein